MGNALATIFGRPNKTPHSSAMDLFNAAGQAAMPFVRDATAKLKERNDLELKNNAAKFATDVQDWMRDNPIEKFGGDLKKYHDAMAAFTGDWYATQGENAGRSLAENTSPYYQRMMGQMKEQSLEMAWNRALAEEDRWRWQKEDVDFKKDVKGYMDSGWTPKMVMDAVETRMKVSKGRRHISPDQEAAVMQGIRTEYYQQYAEGRLGEVKDAIDLDAAMKEVREAFKGVMPDTAVKEYDEGGKEIKTYDEEGNEIEKLQEWGFDNKKEWEDDRVKQHEKRIQNAHFEIVQQKQAWMDRLVASGRIEEAIAYAKREGREWNKAYNPNNERLFANYGGKHRERGSHYFDWRTLEGYRRGGASGAAQAAIHVSPATFIRANWDGVDGVEIPGMGTLPTSTMREAFASFAGAQAGIFRDAHRDWPEAFIEMELQKKQEDWLKEFMGAMEHQMKTEKQVLANKYHQLENYVTSKCFDKGGAYEIDPKIKGDDRTRLIQDVIDFTTDLKWAGVSDPVELERRVKAFIAGDVSKDMTWNSTPDNEGDRTIKLAKYDEEVVGQRKADEQVFSKTRVLSDRLESDEGEDDLVWRSDAFRDSAEMIRTEEWGDAARLLGLEMTKLDVGWMTVGKDKDPIPKGAFTVKGEGELDGKYIMRYDPDSKDRVLYKENEKTGEYEKTDITERRENTAPEQRRLDRYIGEEVARQTGSTSPGSYGNAAWESEWDRRARQERERRVNAEARDRIQEATKDWTFEDWQEYKRAHREKGKFETLTVEMWAKKKAERGSE